MVFRRKIQTEKLLTIINSMKNSVSFSFSRTIIIIFSAALFFSFSVSLQAQDVVNNELVYVVADEMPTFPGETKALNEALGRILVYPETQRMNGVEGKVLVKFIVDKDGNIKNPLVIRSVDPSLDRAAIEAVKKLPRFRPGKIGGNPVNVWYSIPISFKLS